MNFKTQTERDNNSYLFIGALPRNERIQSTYESYDMMINLPESGIQTMNCFKIIFEFPVHF